MYDLVAIGDITVDLFYQGNLTLEDSRFNLAVGGKYYADYFHQGIGGSAANVAIHASTLGMNTAAIAKVGENGLKNLIVQQLTRKSVSTEFLHFEQSYFSVSSILLAPTGERTIIKYSDHKHDLPLSEHTIERLHKTAMIFMGNLPDISIPIRVKLLKSVNNVENTVVINLGSKDCQKGLKEVLPLLESADIIILNKYEFSQLVNRDPEKIDLAKNQLSELKLKNKLLIITDSKNGSFAYTDTEMHSHPGESPKKIVDTTGAGDAYTAGFLVKYHATKKLDVSMEFATKHAVTVLGKVGAN